MRPDIICDARTKDAMKQIFRDISQALPTRKSQLKTKYGLENEGTPLLDLSFDVYRYMVLLLKHDKFISVLLYTCMLQKHSNRNFAHYSFGALQILA